jgi:hypothetical protein
VLSGANFTIRIPCSLLDLSEYINEISIKILISLNLATQSDKATPYFVYNKSDDEENSDSNSDEEYSSSSESEEDEDPNKKKNKLLTILSKRWTIYMSRYDF